MIKEKNNYYAILIFIAVAFSSCASLKSVNDYAVSSSTSIRKFEEINYSFGQFCNDRCLFEAIKNFEIKRENECDCNDFKKADSVTLVIYNSIKGYFDGLSNLSNNDLTSYNFDAMGKSLTEGNFGNVKIEKSQADAYAAISKVLLKSTTDIYRRNKIKKYIEEANEPLQILLSKLQFIIQQNLAGELDFRKEGFYSYYKEMQMIDSISDYEKNRATIDYYREVSSATSLQHQMATFASGLKSIAEGHQKLYDNRNKMTDQEIKAAMMGYSGNIIDVISEFNKQKE